MRTGAHVAAARMDHMTTPCIDQVGLEDSGWLCKLPKCLVVHARLWNLKVPVPGWLSILPERRQLWLVEMITRTIPIAPTAPTVSTAFSAPAALIAPSGPTRL